MTRWRTVKMNVSISRRCCSPLGHSMSLNNVVSLSNIEDLALFNPISIRLITIELLSWIIDLECLVLSSRPSMRKRSSLTTLMIKSWRVWCTTSGATPWKSKFNLLSVWKENGNERRMTDSTRSYRTWLIFNSFRSDPIILYQIEFSQSLWRRRRRNRISIDRSWWIDRWIVLLDWFSMHKKDARDLRCRSDWMLEEVCWVPEEFKPIG